MLTKLFLQYKKRYFEMYGNNSAPAPLRQTGKSAMRKVGVLIRELSDDEDEDGVESSTSHVAANDLCAPWRKDFDGYLNSKDQLGNMSIVEWWGVCISRLVMATILSWNCSGTLLGMMSGHLSHAICSQLWHRLFPVNAHSHLQGSLSLNAVIDSNQTLWRLYSF